MEPSKAIGRPSKKTPQVVDEILLRLAHGEPLARICSDPHMPDFSTVRRWEDEDSEFRTLSTRAREHGTHYMADDCMRIADDPTLDPADKRIRIDTRLRLIGKWNAKNYGDRQIHDVNANLTVAQPAVLNLRALTVEQRETLEQILLLAVSEQAALIGPEETGVPPASGNVLRGGSGALRLD